MIHLRTCTVSPLDRIKWDGPGAPIMEVRAPSLVLAVQHAPKDDKANSPIICDGTTDCAHADTLRGVLFERVRQATRDAVARHGEPRWERREGRGGGGDCGWSTFR